LQKHLPLNVARFEQLMYLSLGIGAIVTMLRWNQTVALAGPVGGASFVLFVDTFVLAFMVLFIWLVARRHKNWARWSLLITFILGLPAGLLALGSMPFHPIAGVLSLAQVALQAIALILIFTGSARAWFRPAFELGT
jgi:hypothetical protein